MAVSEFRFSSWGTGKTSTVKSRKFEVIGTRDFISNCRKFELYGGTCRHKDIKATD